MASRRDFLRGACAAATVAVLPEDGSGPRRRPNILFILADDLGYADIGAYGRRDYRTPVLDGLAADGLLMTQGYANSAVCSPTRVALMTGRYHQRLAVGLAEPIRTAELNPAGLPQQVATLPSLLQHSGYRTALVGKWHLGWPSEHGPLRYGYQRFFGIAAGAVDHFSHREHNLTDPNRPGLYEGDATVSRDGYLTDLLADRAIEEVRIAAAAGAPFLLSLHFTAPHWPWQGPRDAALPPGTNLRHDDGGSLETYGEMVRAMDSAIGRVLAELDRSGAAADTIVIFTSDNGGERFSDTWPLRGGKGDLLEGGIRVPLILRWTEAIQPGRRSDQVMVSMDWLPTLLAAAGATPDSAFPPDGENLLDVLRGEAAERPRKLFWRFRNQDQAAARDGEWKYLRMGADEHLFHIGRDPRERTDLKAHEAARFERLRTDWAAWNAEMLPYPPDSRPEPTAGSA